MVKGTRICKICGKEYPYCKTERSAGIFRYQDVACCVEHGTQYFAEVEAARNPVRVEVATTNVKSKPQTKTVKSSKNDESNKKTPVKD
jgi:hypothetical protein